MSKLRWEGELWSAMQRSISHNKWNDRRKVSEERYAWEILHLGCILCGSLPKTRSDPNSPSNAGHWYLTQMRKRMPREIMGLESSQSKIL